MNMQKTLENNLHQVTCIPERYSTVFSTVDCQLLAEAAAASELSFVGWSANSGPLVSLGIPCPWNPFFDDADALRLAVDLRISIVFHEHIISASFIGSTGRIEISQDLKHTRHLSNTQAAVRHLIVRAAAAKARDLLQQTQQCEDA